MDAYEKKKNNIMKWIRDEIRAKVNSPGMRHVLSRHMNRDKKVLKDRCIVENRIHASTFIGKETDVQELIIRIMLDAAEEIAAWLADDSDWEEWILEGDIPPEAVSGIMYSNTRAHDWADGALDCDSVVVVLVKCSPQENNDFDIKTAYAACKNFV